ncbi:MAG TPA: type VI secretion system tube protein Hcp [Tepidisphaeraceae bacterium]|nr:type VI secretion system tube protein Hcp [Tepidisphaeraceae bacterium]
MRKRCFAALSLALAAGLAAQSRAAIFLQYPTVNGPVTTQGFAGDLELLDFSLATSRAISPPTGSGRESSAPVFSDVSMDAEASSASVQILQKNIEGQAENVKMFLIEPSGNSLQNYAEWDFNNALVSSFSTSSGGDVPVDHFTLNYTAFTYKWTNFDQIGNVIGSVQFGYDLVTQKETLAMQGDTTGYSLVTAEPEPTSAGVLIAALPLLLRRRRRQIAL